jgi:hypothetical protein
MPWRGFEPTTPVFEQAKIVHALDSAATVICQSHYTLDYYLLNCLKLRYSNYTLITHPYLSRLHANYSGYYGLLGPLYRIGQKQHYIFIYTYGIHISCCFSFMLFILQVSVNTCVSFGHTCTSVSQLEYKYCYQHTTGPQKHCLQLSPRRYSISP